jgi:hypothetical protein
MTKLLALFNPFSSIGSFSASNSAVVRTKGYSRPQHTSLYSAPVARKKNTLHSKVSSLQQVGAGYFLFSLCIILLVVHFFGVNQYAAKGYEIKSVQSKIATLNEQNKKLVLRTAEVGSLLEVHNSLISGDFVPVSNAEFLQVNQLSLSSRN